VEGLQVPDIVPGVSEVLLRYQARPTHEPCDVWLSQR
jgi:hypothetical protein